jgi:hypothetical protein
MKAIRVELALWALCASALTFGCGSSEGGGAEGGSGTGGAMGGGAGSSGAGSSGTGGSSAGGGGTDDGGAAGAAGAAGSTGGAAAGSSGSGGAAGSAGSGGSGGSSVQADCPATPPANGAGCSDQYVSCYYENCAADGRTVARCTGGSWDVRSSACDTFTCYSETCAAGQICSVTAGGALFAECIDNPCGTGPITCDCVNPTCANCSLVGSETGVRVTCNTCPGGLPCP